MADGLGPGTPIGKYVVKRKLAEGGMAEIYLASVRGPEGFEKEVVIKRVRGFLATDPSFVQMFIAEARLASRLNHANIVQIFDFDRFEDTFYLAMEYVRGRSLWDVRRKSRERMVPMPPVLVAHIGLEVARGLHYAHRLTDRGQPIHLVHRDVTPHNVLLSWEGAIKLTDFGIAKAGNKLTSPGMLKGKFAYMSPEQARGENVDARTDVFALGVVLWEMLTGGRLFEGDSDVAVLRAVQQSMIAPPGRLNADVAPELDAVVMKALARDPAVRWQTAQELERALAHFILRNAQSVDETDLGAFLRALYADELAGDGLDGSAGGVVNPLPQGVPAAPPPAATPSPSRREPTAVMPGSRGSGARPPHRSNPAPTPSSSVPEAVSVSAPSVPPASSALTAEAGVTTPPPAYAPDEDPHASTFVPRRAEADAGPVVAPISLGTPKYVPPEAEASKGPTTGTSHPELQAVPPRQEPAWVTAGDGASAGEAQQTSGTATANVIAAAQPKRRAGLLGGIAAVAALVAVAGLVLFPRAEPHVPEPPPEVPVAAGAPDAGEEPVDAGLRAWAEEDAGGSTPVLDRADAGVPPSPTVSLVDAGTTPKPTTTRTAGTGTLLVYASPWARLTIDGQRIEEVSGWSNEITLPSGRHVVELWHPRRSQTVTVLIRPGGTRSVKFEVDLD